jgi:hypothetical protein
LERITFRAAYLLYKLFFFDCSESDTFLKNFITNKEGMHYCLETNLSDV